MNLNQVTLPVKQMHEATAFYLKLGFIQIVDTPHYARFECPDGNSTFSLALESESFLNGATIYFEHEELDQWVSNLKSTGVEFYQDPTDQPYLWREAILYDPSGNKIKLYWAGENRLNPPWRVNKGLNKNIMIKKLDNSNEDTANLIHSIFQNSYKVEAQLIGVLDFPPLLRSTKDIVSSVSDFYGFSDNNDVAAIIEIVIEDKHLEINSLTVDPRYFRKGIAGKLISYVLDTFEFSQAIVETAVANKPAINLYKKHGFVEFKRWTPSHGIQKLAMSIG